MALTATQLTNFYSAITLGATPSAAESALISAYAGQDQAGTITDTQAENDVLSFVQADGLTNVALATYQFFTGSAPSQAGLAYLVGPPATGGNPNSLQSSYYAQFNNENRYYNFAINLAFGSSGAANFAATYGPLTFAQAVQVAYESIVGSSVVGATQAQAAEASITADQSYFASIAASRASTQNQDLATKAIMVGYVLEEALKANVGAYANAINKFDFALGASAVGATSAAPAYGTNLLSSYPTGTQGASTTLTTGIDNVTNVAAGTNIIGTFNGATATFNTGDQINVAAGTPNVSLTLYDNGSTSPATASVNAINASVNGVSTLNLIATNAEVVNTTTGFTGLTAVNLTTQSGAVTGTTNNVDVVTAGSGTAVTINDTLVANAAGNLTVTGGSSVTINENNGVNPVQPGADYANGKTITVNGGSATASVTVNQSGTSTAAVPPVSASYQAVAITDANAASGTAAAAITSVSLKNFNGATITDNGLSNLTLAGTDNSSGAGSGVQVVDTGGSASNTSSTLNLALNGFNGAGLTDQGNKFKTINITATGSSQIGGFADSNLANLNVAGTGTVQLTALPGSVSALSISGSAGLIGTSNVNLLDVSGDANLGTVSDTSSGLVAVRVGGSQSFAGSTATGTEIVGITADATKAITFGSNANNELILEGNATNFIGGTTKTSSDVTGFHILGVDTNGSTGVFDLSKLPAVTGLDVRGTAGAIVFSNVTAGTALTVQGALATNTGVTYTTSDTSGASDSVAVTVGNTTSSFVNTNSNGGTQLTFQDSQNTGIGTLTINSIGKASTATPPTVSNNSIGTLTDTGMKSLTVTGNDGLNIATLTDNISTVSLTESGSVTGATVQPTLTISNWTTANLTGLTLSGNVALHLTDTSGAGVTISGGSDNASSLINLGSAVPANNTGNDSVTLGNGTNTILDTNGYSTITVGTGSNAISVAGHDTINLGAHTLADNLTVGALGDTVVSAVITGLNANGADTIGFATGGGTAANGNVIAVAAADINGYAAAHGLNSTQLSGVVAAVEAVGSGSYTTTHALVSGNVAEFQFQGNTYILAYEGAANTSTLVELTGNVSITGHSSATGGVLSLMG